MGQHPRQFHLRHLFVWTTAIAVLCGVGNAVSGWIGEIGGNFPRWIGFFGIVAATNVLMVGPVVWAILHEMGDIAGAWLRLPGVRPADAAGGINISCTVRQSDAAERKRAVHCRAELDLRRHDRHRIACCPRVSLAIGESRCLNCGWSPRWPERGTPRSLAESANLRKRLEPSSFILPLGDRTAFKLFVCKNLQYPPSGHWCLHISWLPSPPALRGRRAGDEGASRENRAKNPFANHRAESPSPPAPLPETGRGEPEFMCATCVDTNAQRESDSHKPLHYRNLKAVRSPCGSVK